VHCWSPYTNSVRQLSQADGEDRLSRADIQRRANQLARALHILDRTQHALMEVGKQANIINGSTPAQLGSIQAYFGPNGVLDSCAIDVDIPCQANDSDIAETSKIHSPSRTNVLDDPKDGKEIVDLTFGEK
jgi:hypothetical protein